MDPNFIRIVLCRRWTGGNQHSSYCIPLGNYSIAIVLPLWWCCLALCRDAHCSPTNSNVEEVTKRGPAGLQALAHFHPVSAAEGRGQMFLPTRHLALAFSILKTRQVCAAIPSSAPRSNHCSPTHCHSAEQFSACCEGHSLFLQRLTHYSLLLEILSWYSPKIQLILGVKLCK